MSAATCQPRNLVLAAVIFAVAMTFIDQTIVFPAALAIVVLARAGLHFPSRPREMRLSRWA
jgi:hypothetical protein